MKVAVITGASSGLGAEFIKKIEKYFPEIEEYWLIARREERMREIASEVSVKCRIMPLDLTLDESYKEIEKTAAEEKADVKLLINNAGCGFLGDVGAGDVSRQILMIELNLKALTAVTHVLLPYMSKGSRIINVSSIASFCANAHMTVYSSTKAYVSSFTRGLAEELRGRMIRVTAVCPGPMDTEFITVGGIKGKSKTFDILPYCDPEKVADGTLRASRKGRVFYTPTFFYKFYRFVAKLLPGAWVVKMCKT